MKHVKLFAALLAFVMLGACTESPEEGGGLSSILIDSSLLEQIFDADQTAPKTISFTAAEAWTATLEETTRTEPSWLRLSAYSGDAGKAQITIEILESNSSSESRFAKITIVCGSYRIAIEIEQKGHGSDNPDNPNDPDTPPTDYKYVARVDYKLTDNREEGATTTVSQSFDYDEENRVARITENYHSTDEYSYKDNGTEIYTFDYTIANEVSVRTTDEAERLLYKISAKTDEKGRITETSSYDYDNGTPRLEGQETYTYTPEGRLSSLLSKYSYSSSSGLNQYSENKFYYTDGLLTRYTYYDSYEASYDPDYQPWEYSLPADECYPHRYANDRSNLDFYMYAMGGRISFENTSSAIFSLLRLTGNYGDCLPEITTAADEDDEVGGDEVGGYPTPNVTLHKSYTTTESACGEDEYLKLRIETDADNAVKRISYDVPYEEYQVEYDIVVGNEVIDEAMNHPEFPEEGKLYKYEIKNRTKTKIRDIVNPATIEITYR